MKTINNINNMDELIDYTCWLTLTCECYKIKSKSGKYKLYWLFIDDVGKFEDGNFPIYSTEEIIKIYLDLKNHKPVNNDKCNCKSGYIIDKDDFGATGKILKCNKCNKHENNK